MIAEELQAVGLVCREQPLQKQPSEQAGELRRRHRYREIALNSASTFSVDFAFPPLAAVSKQWST